MHHSDNTYTKLGDLVNKTTIYKNRHKMEVENMRK